MKPITSAGKYVQAGEQISRTMSYSVFQNKAISCSLPFTTVWGAGIMWHCQTLGTSFCGRLQISAVSFFCLLVYCIEERVGEPPPPKQETPSNSLRAMLYLEKIAGSLPGISRLDWQSSVGTPGELLLVDVSHTELSGEFSMRSEMSSICPSLVCCLLWMKLSKLFHVLVRMH